MTPQDTVGDWDYVPSPDISGIDDAIRRKQTVWASHVNAECPALPFLDLISYLSEDIATEARKAFARQRGRGHRISWSTYGYKVRGVVLQPNIVNSLVGAADADPNLRW